MIIIFGRKNHKVSRRNDTDAKLIADFRCSSREKYTQKQSSEQGAAALPYKNRRNRGFKKFELQLAFHF